MAMPATWSCRYRFTNPPVYVNLKNNLFFYQAANQTVYRGDGGERTVYLLPGEAVTLICQGEISNVLWSKDGQVSKNYSELLLFLGCRS